MIISNHNGNYIDAVKLKDKKYRDEAGLFLIEGSKLFEEAVRYGVEIQTIFVLKDRPEFEFDLFDGIKVFEINESMMKRLSDKVSPQGIVAIAKRIKRKPQKTTGKALILDEISDPNNMGAILRTACGAGYNDIYCIGGADPFSPKCISGGMSAQFVLNIYECTHDQALSFNGENELFCCDMTGENLFEIKAAEKHTLILGNEGRGVSQALQLKADRKIGIPMKNGLESLNVAVSAGIIMYVLSFNNKLL